jgi:hypothetical protein
LPEGLKELGARLNPRTILQNRPQLAFPTDGSLAYGNRIAAAGGGVKNQHFF